MAPGFSFVRRPRPGRTRLPTTVGAMTSSARPVYTRLQLLIIPSQWEALQSVLPEKLQSAGLHNPQIWATETNFTCEPDNMLVTEFAQREGHVPITEVVHRVTVTAHTDLPLHDVTTALIAALPEGTYWYGSSYEGTCDLEEGDTNSAACAWQS